MEEHNTTPETTQQRVTEKIKTKGRKAVEKNLSTLKVLKVEYVPVGSLQPNEYNPNRQDEHEFELLCRSMQEDGFTQPIVVHRGTMTIIDGEHRWRAAQALGFDEIPVVFTEMTPEQMRIATLRHNRARGQEDIILTADVYRDLEQLGARGWLLDSMMMTGEELDRILEDIPTPEALAGEEFGPSWIPDELDKLDDDAAESGLRTYTVNDQEGGQSITKGVTPQAQKTIRRRKDAIDKAKTQDERRMAMQRHNIFRLTLIFSGDEADIVKRALGENPADTIISWCRQAVSDG